MGSAVSVAELSSRLDHEPVLVLLGELAGGADHLVDQRSEVHRLED